MFTAIALPQPGGIMTDRTYRVTEIVGTSPDGIETAIRNGVQRAAQTLPHLDWFEVTEVRGQIRGAVVPSRARRPGRPPGLWLTLKLLTAPVTSPSSTR